MSDQNDLHLYKYHYEKDGIQGDIILVAKTYSTARKYALLEASLNGWDAKYVNAMGSRKLRSSDVIFSTISNGEEEVIIDRII